MTRARALLAVLAVALAPHAARAQDDAWLDALEEEVEAEGEPEGASGAAPEDDAAGDDDWLEALEEDVASEDAPEEDEPLVLPLMGETTFSLTNTTVLEYRRNPAESEGGFAFVLTDKLDLAAQGEDVRVAARVDTFAPFRDAQCETDTHSLCSLEYDLRVPERVSLLWEPGDFSVEVGDSYAVFGRGLALSLRKVDLLGIDTSVRGGHVQYEGGRVRLALLGGLANPQNLDPISLQVFDDPDDVIAGASAGVRLGANEELELGVHGTRVWFEENEASGVEVTGTVVGWRAGAPSLFDGRLALYAEANAMVREGPLRCAEERCFGRAVYGSAQVNAGDLSVLLEWKDYSDYLLAPSNSTANEPWRVYSDVPSLDRDTERFRGVHNSRGGAVQVAYAFPESPWSVAANGIFYGHEDEDLRFDPWEGVLVTHGYAVLRRQNESVDQDELGWTLDLSGGYRRETHLRAIDFLEVEEGDLDWRVVHFEVDATLGKGDHSFELVAEHRMERRLLFDYIDYVRGGVTLTWSYAGALSVSPILRWDTEKKSLVEERSLGAFYAGGEVRWQFLEGSHVRVFGGQTPGGRLCSGGICRDVPPFEGVLGEVVLRL